MQQSVEAGIANKNDTPGVVTVKPFTVVINAAVLSNISFVYLSARLGPTAGIRSWGRL
jgi:hypothetical protein